MCYDRGYPMWARQFIERRDSLISELLDTVGKGLVRSLFPLATGLVIGFFPLFVLIETWGLEFRKKEDLRNR